MAVRAEIRIIDDEHPGGDMVYSLEPYRIIEEPVLFTKRYDFRFIYSSFASDEEFSKKMNEKISGYSEESEDK